MVVSAVTPASTVFTSASTSSTHAPSSDRTSSENQPLSGLWL